jgi:hypothetical protein
MGGRKKNRFWIKANLDTGTWKRNAEKQAL